MVNLKISIDVDSIGENAENFNYKQFEIEIIKGIHYEYPEEKVNIEFVQFSNLFVEIETDNNILKQYIEDILETIDISEDKYYK